MNDETAINNLLFRYAELLNADDYLPDRSPAGS
jgi:hypothetical protein